MFLGGGFDFLIDWEKLDRISFLIVDISVWILDCFSESTRIVYDIYVYEKVNWGLIEAVDVSLIYKSFNHILCLFKALGT